MSMTIAGAKKFLEEQGYYTHNLWHIDDVMDSYKCSEEEALLVLDKALSNEWTMEQIWFGISEEAIDLGLERTEP